jgi:hypothetical protein
MSAPARWAGDLPVDLPGFPAPAGPDVSVDRQRRALHGPTDGEGRLELHGQVPYDQVVTQSQGRVLGGSTDGRRQPVVAQLAGGRSEPEFGLSPGFDVTSRRIPAIPLSRVARAGSECSGEIRGGAGDAVVDVGGNGAVDAGQALLKRQARSSQRLRLEGSDALGSPSQRVGRRGPGGQGRLHFDDGHLGALGRGPA